MKYEPQKSLFGENIGLFLQKIMPWMWPPFFVFVFFFFGVSHSHAMIYGGNYPDTATTTFFNYNSQFFPLGVPSTTQVGSSSYFGMVDDASNPPGYGPLGELAYFSVGSTCGTWGSLSPASSYDWDTFNAAVSAAYVEVYVATDQFGNEIHIYNVGNGGADVGNNHGNHWNGWFDCIGLQPAKSGGGTLRAGYGTNSHIPFYAMGDSISAVYNALNGGGSLPPVAKFIFPTSTYSGPDFSNWAAKLTSLATNTTYYGAVSYQVGPVWTFVQKINTDYFSINTGNATSVIWTVPKSLSLFAYQNNTGATSSWTATIAIGLSPDLNVATSDQETFVISPFATSTPVLPGANLAGPFFYNSIQQTPSIAPENFASSSAAFSAACPAPGGFTDWGGGLYWAACSTFQLLLIPSPSAQNNLTYNLQRVEGQAPLSWFFATTQTITSSTVAMNTSTAQGWVMPIQNFDGTTSTITLMPALASAVPFMGGSAFQNTLFNLILDFVSLCALTLIFAVVKWFLQLV